MKLQQFEALLLQASKEANLQQAEMYAERSTSLLIKVYNQDVDAYETSQQGGVSFRAVYQGKMGYAYTEKITEDSIPFLIEAVKENAEVLEVEDETTIFTGSTDYAQGDFYKPKAAAATPEQMITLLRNIEKEIKAYDERIISVNYCQLQQYEGERQLANSLGLHLYEKGNGLIVLANAVAKSNQETKTGAHSAQIHDITTFDWQTFAQQVAKNAIALLGGQSLPSASYPVILENKAAVSLLSVYTNAFSAEQVQKGMSRLDKQVGKQIASSVLTIIDEPRYKEALTQTAFDAEGVATIPTTIIKQGYLQTFLHNRQTAKKAGETTTGHAAKASYKDTLSVAPHHFVVQQGTESFQKMMSTITNGILIHSLTGLHAGANSVSGDFSLAATGFHIKDGNIASALKQMTIAGNFFTLLQDVQQVSNDVYVGFGSVSSPSWYLPSLAVTIE